MDWGYLKSWFESIWYKVASFFLFQKELSIAVIGLQNSGKTTFVQLLSGKPFLVDTVPTLGIQSEKFTLGNNSIIVYDLAGQTRFQPLWERCFDKVDLIVYMIDLSDLHTLEESFTKLTRVIQMTNDDKIPLLIMGNKTDAIPDASSNPSYSTKCLPETLLADYNYDTIECCKLEPSNLHLLKNVESLSKQLGIDLRNHVLHVPFGGPTESLPLDRDIAIFTVSCKTGGFIKDVMDWIVQL
ncbi:hypothetical protein ZYGR_0AF01460 [Zygosaccharomyces rouxii]|uniref:Uncharacterized protein n=1 Tax=Zygosaccharomyces rouxii TaxID=4956 RepID=A0A1Q3A7G4_ZYGRO|nr:hypothetical protein ZYGR_0AF01460 [Zygosaccharomyces rouxii]